MPLEKYEDFLDMNIKDLQDYLAFRGLNTSGRKKELAARAFAAFELKIEIKSTSEDQRKRLETEYLQNIKDLFLPDANIIEESKRLNNTTKWPMITIGCNHVIATLYNKLEYANSKGWCNPACTETACQWNQGTHKKVKLKHIADLSVSKKLGSNTSKVDKEAPEETRMKHLQDFDLCIESHRNIIVDDVSTFL